MKLNEILNMSCSIFINIVNSKEPFSVSGCTVGDFIQMNNDKLKKASEIIKSEAKHSFLYDKIKRENIPCATLSCTCTYRNSDSVVQRNPIMVLDIDYDESKGENLFLKDHKEDIKNLLIKLPYVVCCDDSCSGTGIYVIVLICSNDDDDDFKTYFYSLEKKFKDFGITVDPACKDVVRLRVASYSKPLLKPLDEDIEPYKDKLFISMVGEPKIHKINTHRRLTIEQLNNDNELILQNVISKLISKGYSTDDYVSWIRDMYYLVPFGNLGYEMMLDISKNSFGYVNEDNVLSQWNKIPEKNTKDDAYRYYFGQAKKLLGPNYYRDICNEIKQEKERNKDVK